MASILVVDDEMGIRELLNEILTDEGHTVYAAESAIQARTVREQMRPDLVLLDIWMPDTDGITLLKEWSNSGQLTMPVVMMSGHATIDTAVEATRIGALNFLEKPIALQKLLKTVNKALESAPKQMQIEEAAAILPSSRPAALTPRSSARMLSAPKAMTSRLTRARPMTRKRKASSSRASSTSKATSWPPVSSAIWQI